MRDVTESIDCRRAVAWSTAAEDGVLAGLQKSALAQHLEDCDDCSRFYRQIELLTTWVRKPESATLDGERRRQLLATALGTANSSSAASAGATGSVVVDVPGSCDRVDAETAVAYLDDRLSDEEQIAVLQHLIDGCTSCVFLCRSLAFPEWHGRPVQRREMRERRPDEEERARYETCLAELLQDGWRGVVTPGIDLQHFHLWIIRRARERFTVDPSEVLSLSRLSLAIGQTLGGESLARAYMLSGTAARRVEADFLECHRFFDLAEGLLSESTTDRLLFAKLMRLRGIALFAQSRADEAKRAFCTAEKCYVEHEELQRLGECLLDASAPEAEVSSSARAVIQSLAATTVVDWKSFPRYSVALGQNLSLYYSDQALWPRALLALSIAERRLRSLDPAPVDEVYLQWMRGRLLHSAGRGIDAAEELASVKDAFVELGLPSEVAWVSLDLALVHVDEGAIGDCYELLEPLLAYFVSRRLPRESLLALELLRRSIAERTVSAAKLRALRERLLRTRPGDRA